MRRQADIGCYRYSKNGQYWVKHSSLPDVQNKPNALKIRPHVVRNNVSSTTWQAHLLNNCWLTSTITPSFYCQDRADTTEDMTRFPCGSSCP